ncbi:MAG: stimulus-sensing domain-containing protein [Rhodovibrionaceae bacterium]
MTAEPSRKHDAGRAAEDAEPADVSVDLERRQLPEESFENILEEMDQEEDEDRWQEAAAGSEHRPRRRRRRRRAWSSPLTRKILAINLLALVIPILGLLHLDDYRQTLIASEQEAMLTQAQAFSVALGATAVRSNDAGEQILLHETARLLMRQFWSDTALRARVFGRNGVIVADSAQLSGASGQVIVEELVTHEESFGDRLLDRMGDAYDAVSRRLAGSQNYPRMPDGPNLSADAFDEVIGALEGETPARVRARADGRLALTIAVPVQRYRQIAAALLLSKDGTTVMRAVSSRRRDILIVFGAAFTITVLLSLYLARTIARPIQILAGAASRVRGGRGGISERAQIPDFTARQDEIGDLSGALIDMTNVLQERLDAIEGFAADVAHEIKNPLTSLRSAVETVKRVENPEQQKKLMSIILDDVQRLDRLISDISDASRLDAELLRAEMEPVDVAKLLEALVDVHRAGAESREGAPRFEMQIDRGQALQVQGLEGRIGQVFRNLISNAVSFSPPGGVIRLEARLVPDADPRNPGWVMITVADEGPGIPQNKIKDVFSRFYTQRPEGEKFGTHSGLGLSISKQIVEAHHGAIHAENRHLGGKVAGARFVVYLPAE